MINEANKILDRSEFKENQKDLIFCIVDTDGLTSKIKILRTLFENYNNDRLIIIFSNPTIEVWYRLHFKYSTRSYRNGNEVIADLKKYIPQYTKSLDCFPILSSKTWDAVENSQRLLTFYSQDSKDYLTVLNHTGTMMHLMIKKILNRC